MQGHYLTVIRILLYAITPLPFCSPEDGLRVMSCYILTFTVIFWPWTAKKARNTNKALNKNKAWHIKLCLELNAD